MDIYNPLVSIFHAERIIINIIVIIIVVVN